jgi:hypothetical protein
LEALLELVPEVVGLLHTGEHKDKGGVCKGKGVPLEELKRGIKGKKEDRPQVELTLILFGLGRPKRATWTKSDLLVGGQDLNTVNSTLLLEAVFPEFKI